MASYNMLMAHFAIKRQLLSCSPHTIMNKQKYYIHLYHISYAARTYRNGKAQGNPQAASWGRPGLENTWQLSWVKLESLGVSRDYLKWEQEATDLLSTNEINLYIKTVGSTHVIYILLGICIWKFYQCNSSKWFPVLPCVMTALLTLNILIKYHVIAHLALEYDA